MTYIQIINILNELCSSLPDVNTVVREFLDLNREDTLYSAMVVQDRDGARTEYTYQSYNEFTFYIGYVDRLTPSKDNVDDIVSTGINHINTLISSLEELDITVSSSSLVSFTQRFTAECAGVYLGITLSVPVDCTIPSIHIGDCKTEPKEETITHNGSFTFIPEGEVIGFSKFTVNVDVPERKPEESLDTTITSNGDYTYNPKEGQVFDSVRVNVDVPYKPEKELTDLITSNGTHTYTPEENEVYNSVKINVEVHPEEKLEETITTNGSFTYTGEWKDAGITVAVPIPEQKEEVELTGTITKNGITYYTPEENQTYKSAVITTDIHPSESLNETITANGSFSYPGEYNGVEIKVNVPATPQKTEVSLVQTITSNGSFTYTPEEGQTFDEVNITADIHPSDRLTLSITENKIYTSDSDFSGYDIVVNVPGGEGNSCSPYDGSLYFHKDSFRAMGYTDEDICYLNSAIRYYSYLDDTYYPPNSNVSLYGKVNAGNIQDYKDDVNMRYVPNFDATGVSGDSLFINCKWIYSIPNYQTSFTSAKSMFYGCSVLHTIPKIDVSQVANFSNMFYGCSALTSVPVLDTSSATNVDGMFSGCSSLQSVPKFSFPKVKTANGMFSGCSSLLLVPSEWDWTSITEMSGMFEGCSSLLGTPVVSNSSAKDVSGMYKGCTSLKEVELDIDFPKANRMQYMFSGCTALTAVGNITISSKDTLANNLMENCSSLVRVGDITVSSTGVNMAYLFSNCRKLVTVSSIDVTGANSFTSAFSYCYALKNITFDGSLNYSVSFYYATLTYDSIKSILTSASNKTSSSSYTLEFNQTITDQDGELAALVSTCTEKNWTVTGLTIQ